ncbi:sulfur carrier protein ThiS [Sphingobacterium sp. HJSM2_6]|uniref:sulfur carrier protein ThiS n=1 Tax=Sphingobacterium sp. HJSM2_6 TaxID=3366264 RepID=UPI003BE9B41C
MKLTINQKTKEFIAPPQHLADIVQLETDVSKKGIAVALNYRVIPKNLWDTTPVQENDSILIINATQGG